MNDRNAVLKYFLQIFRSTKIWKWTNFSTKASPWLTYNSSLSLCSLAWEPTLSPIFVLRLSIHFPLFELFIIIMLCIVNIKSILKVAKRWTLFCFFLLGIRCPAFFDRALSIILIKAKATTFGGSRTKKKPAGLTLISNISNTY